MKVIQLSECHSTQEYLKNQLALKKLEHPVLVSCEKQTKGKGRRNNSWHQFENSLAFSFTCKAFSPVTLSPLAIAVEICELFKENSISLKLKWPNDILNLNGKKMGGILCEVLNQDLILVGVGLNLYPSDELVFDYPHGFIFEEKSFFSKDQFFINLMNRIEKRGYSYKENWEKYCYHLGKKVQIKESDGQVNGVFEGLGPHGEALLKLDSGELKSLFTGSLRTLSN